MNELLTIFRNRLLDLSSSNRSVFLPKVYKGKFSDLKTWDYRSERSALDIIKALLSGKASVKIADLKFVPADALEEVLEEAKKIMRTRQLILDETGSADFYVGWPFVEGVLKNGMPLRAPLLFFPYQLKQVGREITLERSAMGEAFWNRSLFLSLAYFEEYQFDTAWLEAPVTNIEDTPDQDFRIQLIDQLKQQGWSPAFDRDFLSDNLQHFLPMTKTDLLANNVPGHYKLKSYAVMGLFPQSASYIHSDYDLLRDKVQEQDLETLFSEQYTQDEVVETFKSHHLEYTPLALDGAQETIISRVSSGQSLVVQGPPGSGKTQLICNLIAQFLGKGKKVLVVCQKKAALDVIYERLQSIALEQFVALLHDAVADKKTLYEKIAGQIESATLYKKQNIHPDTLVLEKEFSRIQTAIARLLGFFSRYKQALYDTGTGGETAHALYLKSNRNFSVVNLDLEFRSIPVYEVESKCADLEQYLFYYTAIQHDGALIQESTASELSVDDKEHMMHLIQQVNSSIEKINAQVAQEPLLSQVSLSMAAEWLQKISQWQATSLIWEHNISYDQAVAITPHKLSSWNHRLSEARKTCSNIAVLPPPEHVSSWLVNINKASDNIFKRWYVQLHVLFDKELKQWFSKNNIRADKNGLAFSVEVFRAVQDMADLKQEWQAYSFLLPSTPFSETYFIEAVAVFERLYRETQDISDIPALFTLWRSTPSFKERTNHLMALVQERNDLLQPYFRHWKAGAVDRLFQDRTYREQWLEFITNRFERWLGHEQLKKNLDSFVWSSFQKVTQQLSCEDPSTVIETWKQSVWRAWIDEKERLSPELKSVSAPEWELKEKELQSLTDRRYSISLEFLKIKLREWVYAGIQYNRLQRQVTYRDLSHQVNKKRSVWPVRKLLAQHEEEVLDLIPCWLISPETASTVFPMHSLFDLVIFDEASQCFVEKAFPSLFRAKQAVVIGDDKQLKPNDLYRVRYKKEDEEEDLDQEAESLLDFFSRYFPSHMLTGHYRSKSEALIRFSNRHFYEQRLRIVPDIAYADRQVLQFVKVEGVWHNNTNQEEALQVKKLVEEFLLHAPGKSIGIITFNYPQAFLIKDTLEQSGLKLPADLLIKNIENVQGDERDIIIFSVAYARNKEGKIVTQFGSLSQDGGENRLNVAVTRAREKVVVVSSILPEELQVAHHKHQGPELLKQYLHYVYRYSQNPEGSPETLPPTQPSTSRALSSLLLQHRPQQYVPSYFSDLRYSEAPDHLLFTDDERYFYAPSLSDWHAYTPKLFREKGWTISYGHAREYWVAGGVINR